MKISGKTWNEYVQKLSKLSSKAGEEMKVFMKLHGFADQKLLVDYAYALINKYGEGAGALACEMYEAVAELSGVLIQAAEVADVATYQEVYSAIASAKGSEPLAIGSVERLVKLCAADTTLKNAIRDGAEFAWIPHGDTCAFCLTLASRGWQKASKSALKGNHASHIHSHCDCNYQIRFNKNTDVDGYDPQAYYREYMDASDSHSSEAKMKALRRAHYQRNKDKINEQKRLAYKARKEREQSSES